MTPEASAALQCGPCGVGDHEGCLNRGGCSRCHGSVASAACPKWGDLGHNWIVIKGWLPWRRYRVCCACDQWERIR